MGMVHDAGFVKGKLFSAQELRRKSRDKARCERKLVVDSLMSTDRGKLRWMNGIVKTENDDHSIASLDQLFDRAIEPKRRPVQSYVEISPFPLEESGSPSVVNSTFSASVPGLQPAIESLSPVNLKTPTQHLRGT